MLTGCRQLLRFRLGKAYAVPCARRTAAGYATVAGACARTTCPISMMDTIILSLLRFLCKALCRAAGGLRLGGPSPVARTTLAPANINGCIICPYDLSLVGFESHGIDRTNS